MDGWMDMCLCILYVIYVYVCVYNMFKHIYTHATQHTRGPWGFPFNVSFEARYRFGFGLAS